jgi:hypothetical protein
MLSNFVLLFPTVLLLNPHQCSSLAQNPRSRREFVVDSVASIASISTVAGITFIPDVSSAIDEVITTSTQLELPPIGIGAWAWGDSIFWGYDKKVSSHEASFDSCLLQHRHAKYLTKYRWILSTHCRTTTNSRKCLNMH